MKGLGKPERDSSILIGRSDDRLGFMWSGAPSGAGEASCMPHVGQYGAHVGAQRPGGLGRHVGGGVEAVVEGVAPGLQVGFQEADVGLSACVAVGVRQVAVGGSRQEVVYAGLSGQQAVRGQFGPVGGVEAQVAVGGGCAGRADGTQHAGAVGHGQQFQLPGVLRGELYAQVVVGTFGHLRLASQPVGDLGLHAAVHKVDEVGAVDSRQQGADGVGHVDEVVLYLLCLQSVGAQGA